MKLATRIFVLLLVLGCYLTATGFFFETMLCFPDKVWGISMMAPLFLVGTFTFVVLDINERAHLQPLQCCRDFLSVCSCTCCCDDGGHVSGSSRDKQRSKFIFTFNMSLVMVAMTLILYLGGKHQIPGSFC
jgi:hypothetical protein